VYFLAAMAALALLTLLWSIAPDETVKTGISLALTFFSGAVLIGCAARLMRHRPTSDFSRSSPRCRL